MSTVVDEIKALLGIDQGSLDLDADQMLLRAVITYLIALVFIRLGDKRFLGQNTAFDVILGVVLGSVMSRAVTGNSAFVPTIAAATALVAMHWLLAFVSFRSRRVSGFVKGAPRVLIENGELQHDNMRRSHIAQGDLTQALHVDTGTQDLDKVEAAYLERSGDITFIPRTREAKILEVRVEDGVQTVRIELG